MINYEPLLRTQKTPENAHSMGFSGVRKSILLRSLLIHLLCELFDGMLDLCGIERGSVLSLPVFEMVKNFCLLFSSLNPMVLKIGKSVLKVGKTAFLLYTEETSEVFPFYFP